MRCSRMITSLVYTWPDGSETIMVPRRSAPQQRKRRGPQPGTLRRYEAADRALFPKLEQIMADKMESAWRAACTLAENGEVAGMGSSSWESRAKRLLKLYNETPRTKKTH